MILEEVKNYLDIPWETTPAEDAKLSSMIERGKAALAGKIGVILRGKPRKKPCCLIM